MLRINILVLGLACLSASSASADFIAAPVASLASEADPRLPSYGAEGVAADNGAQQLWRDSAYLELGYYSSDGKLSQKQVARPTEAALEPDGIEAAAGFSMGRLARGRSDALVQLSAAAFAVFSAAAYAVLRTRHARSRA